jgi:hypothetical protein
MNITWQKMRKLDNPNRVEVSRETVKKSYKQFKKILKENGHTVKKLTLAGMRRQMELANKEEVYVNDLYQVHVDYENDIPHLSIKNNQKTTDISWQHKQWIKNDILGEEFEACELFPAESRLVNTANQYHLWGFPKGTMNFGWNARLVTNETPKSSDGKGIGKQTLQTR